ncbi:MAG TPA: PEP/pyruvate-binding domain-containing protein [Polyangiaceae bacterium]|jgi:pyruvate,water dikinase|nr:PEP/pyruvate-binding domain-containing protein [Polyangiaceae bacterium]
MVRFGRSRPRAVVSLADPAFSPGRRDTELGSLATALAGVTRLGGSVPETFVVTADVFRHVVNTALPPGHDPASLVRTVRRPIGVERAARAREKLLAVTLDGEVEREIDVAFAELVERSPWGVAVRASPLLSDQGASRAAGLSLTELPVKTRNDVGAAIRWAWARAASEVTLEHLRVQKVRDLAVAVVLQPVLDARATVTFVTDPRAPLADGPRYLAIATSGLTTESVDLAAAELVTFDAEGTVQSRRPPRQPEELVVRDRALVTASREATRPILSPADTGELASLARRLESFGRAVVRCAFGAAGELSVLDVTPLEHDGRPGTGALDTLWVRTAVDEAPSAPLTPLSAQLLRQPLIARGRLASGERAPRQGRLATLLSNVDGRPYLSLPQRLERDAERDPVDLIGHVELGSGQWTRTLIREPAIRPSLARAGLRIAQIASEQNLLTDETGRFERDAEQQRRWLAELDLGILPDDALTTTLHEVSQFLSRAYALHGRAHALAVAGHALLSSVLTSADAAHAAWSSHAVSAGAGVVTSRPAAAFCHVAAIARFDVPALTMVTRGELTSLSALPDGPLGRAMRQFLKAYGDRGVFETELASPRWAESAGLLSAMLAAALRGEAVDPDVAASRARALADRALALLEPGLSFFENRVVRDIVSRQRDLLRLRERCRVRIAHGLSMMRVVMLDVDRRIRRLDPTLDDGAALFLTLRELTQAVAKYRADLAPIVRARRADLAAQSQTRESASVFRGSPKPNYPRALASLVSGLPLAAGSAEGRVTRLGPSLSGLERFAPGDVLCVKTLDLGLTPLFLHARAVVTELGTPFSSSSVVARDYGVPVVCVESATALLRDGDRVRVDGDAGTVELS